MATTGATARSDYDAIVIGAGHNGLTTASVLQRAGLRVLVLEKNHYAGGMASTVEVFPGYHFEIAGSVVFAVPDIIFSELGLDAVPTFDTEVMSVNVGRPESAPMIFYSDPMRLAEHVAETNGAEAVLGMAELIGWCDAPARALGRFEVERPPRSLDEMFDIATSEAEREAIRLAMFGSVMDVIDRFLPDANKHAMLRGMLAFLSINSTYRGPYSPGSALCLAYALATPPEMRLMRKFQGGIGALVDHVHQRFLDDGGELRYRAKVAHVTVNDGGVTGVEMNDGTVITAPIVVSNLDPTSTFTRLIDPATVPKIAERVSCVDHRGAYIQVHFALHDLPTFEGPYELLNQPGLMAQMGMFGSPEDMQEDFEQCRRGRVPVEPSMGMQIPSILDPAMAPEGKHAASAFAMYFPVENTSETRAALADEMTERVIAKVARMAPNFPDVIDRRAAFASFHYEAMYGCTGGDFCHGLIHPDLMGSFRPGPRGWNDLEIPIGGLYLCGAGCHGGPGVTFIPGYNCGRAILEAVA